MRAHAPEPIDGYDWDIGPEPVTYRTQARLDALDRARRWRIEQGDDPNLVARIGSTTLNADGWMHVGTLSAWLAPDLRVFWRPEDDAVRVERPPAPDFLRLPSPPPPLPPEPITFSADVTIVAGPSVIVKFRRVASRGRPDPGTYRVRLVVPPPDPAVMKRFVWEWTMRMASHRHSHVTVPDDFYERDATARRDALITAVHQLAIQIDQMPTKRR